MIIPAEHRDHWMEPKNISRKRDKSEKFCESCGVAIPFHDRKCSFLKGQTR